MKSLKSSFVPAAVLAAAISLAPCFSGAASAENTAAESSAVLAETGAAAAAVQIPNPMVPYTSYADMTRVLGFRPLVLPRAEGYARTEAFVIGGDVADLRYQSRYGAAEQRSELTIRTARRNDLQGEDVTTLSGIYSVDWQTMKLGANTMQFAQAGETSFVACWTEGGYVFTCEGRNFNRWDFTHRIVYDLMDLTDHYYAED